MKASRITIHCSASPNGKYVPRETLEQWHLDRGFSSLGYHLVIEPNGEVINGRPLNAQGAHVLGENENNIGICLVGTDKFTRVQFDALRYKLDGIIMIYEIKPWEIYAHNQFKSAIAQGKICPGFSVNILLAWYIGHHEKALEPHILKD